MASFFSRRLETDSSLISRNINVFLEPYTAKPPNEPKDTQSPYLCASTTQKLYSSSNVKLTTHKTATSLPWKVSRAYPNLFNNISCYVNSLGMFGGFTVRPADNPKIRTLVITFYECMTPWLMLTWQTVKPNSRRQRKKFQWKKRTNKKLAPTYLLALTNESPPNYSLDLCNAGNWNPQN